MPLALAAIAWSAVALLHSRGPATVAGLATLLALDLAGTNRGDHPSAPP